MPKQKLWIPGKLPGMNEIIAAAKKRTPLGHGKKMVFEYTHMKNDLELFISLQCVKYNLYKVSLPCFFVFEWREANRRRDKDNITAARKFIMDGMVKGEVLPDDGWKYVDGWTDKFKIDRYPGVMVEIIEEGE